MPSRLVLLFTLAFLVILLSQYEANGQAIHLPPPYKATIERGATLLEIKATHQDFEGTTISVQDDQIILKVPGQPSEVIPIADRTLYDIANAIRALHPELDVRSSYSLRSAHYLKESERPLTIEGSDYSAVASRENEPNLFLGFGLLLAMGPPEVEERQGLLNQAGFQFDIGGFHKIVNYKSKKTKQEEGKGNRLARKFATPSVYFTSRVGLNANQEQLVGNAEGAITDPVGSPGQFDAALQRADQVSLTSQIDAAWQLGSSKQELAIYAGGGVSYTQLEPYTLPLISVNRMRLPTEEVFDADAVSSLTEAFNRTIPLWEYGYGAVLRFIRDDQIAFYVGGGFHSREVVVQRMLFERDADDIPDPFSLRGEVGADDRSFWRALIGVRLAGIMDLRVDAIGPFNRNYEPVLRIVLARDLILSQ